MSYEIGIQIDLSYLNGTSVSATQKKSSSQETISQAYDVGTQIVFKFTNQSFQSFRRIPVSFA